MATNLLLDRYRVDWTDAELDAAIVRSGIPLPDLSKLSTEEAKARLQVCLAGLVVPSSQMRAGVRKLHSLSRAAMCELAADGREYLRRAYSTDPAPCTVPIFCLTGHAGGGKSEILKAFSRSLPDPIQVDFEGHASAKLVSAYLLKARSGIGLAQILKPVFPQDCRRPGSAFGYAQHLLALYAVGSLLGDEIQFVSQSSNATQIANLLLTISQLGPHFSYACNFSLLHRLLKRPKEQRDRLVADVRLVELDTADSVDWECFCDASLSVEQAFSELRARRGIALDLHQFTFGIRRSVRVLLVLAYGIARERGSTVVSFMDLEKAYLSFAFAAMRQDVELLTAGAFGNLKRRLDLWCPLEAEGVVPPDQHSRAKSEQDVALAQAALAHSLTADVPPLLSSTPVWSPIPHIKEIGREEALFRRTDHRLPA